MSDRECRALFDLERYPFIWKVKLVHSIAEHPTEINNEDATKCYYITIIVGIFSKKNCVNFWADRNITLSSPSNYVTEETWPFYRQKVVII